MSFRIHTPESMRKARQERKVAEYQSLIESYIQRMMEELLDRLDFLIKCSPTDSALCLYTVHRVMNHLDMKLHGWDYHTEIRDESEHKCYLHVTIKAKE